MTTEKPAAPARVLVVDDEEEVLFATARMLRTAGYDVLEARSGRECLRQVSEQRPDLVILDVVLQDMSGIEALQEIKARPGAEPVFVVLVSGKRITPEEQAQGLEAGAEGYVARPFSRREFLARVEAFLRIQRAEKERDRLIAELRKALGEIKTLSGLLPICVSCKKVRDDTGYWQQIEQYVRDRSDADFSHGICPECAARLYPDFLEEKRQEGDT